MQKRRCLKILRNRKKRKRKRVIRTHQRTNGFINDNDKETELKKTFPGYKYVNAPSIFSFVQNKHKVLKFLQQLRECKEKKKQTLVRLDGVEQLSTDAILVLLSTMVQFQTEHVRFNGTKPVNEEVRLKLESSGFFHKLYSIVEKERYQFKSITNQIYTHGQKTVAPGLADDLVKYGSKTVWNESRRCPGIQKTLLELMHNTYDHAGISKGEKHWWLSVEHNESEKEVTFAFIDFGVGIFRSLSNKSEKEPLYGALQSISHKFPFATTQVDKLKLILEGKVQLSQSNKYFRGKGLAKIYNHYLNNKIASLCIISNFAFVDADKNEFITLENEFMGTFISFKIKKDIVSLPWRI